jgi:HAD superfamily hydrolase (TIGR01490 family)
LNCGAEFQAIRLLFNQGIARAVRYIFIPCALVHIFWLSETTLRLALHLRGISQIMRGTPAPLVCSAVREMFPGDHATSCERQMLHHVVAVFDFDGTITTKDTFLPFLFRVFGKLKVYKALIDVSILLGSDVLFRPDRDKFKALLVEKLFRGFLVSDLARFGDEHAKYIASWHRPKAIERIHWHKQQGHRLVMVSASLEFYLEPIAKQLGFDDLLCTEIASTQGICSGRLKGRNCRAAEKVKRLEALLGTRGKYKIYAYGDSDGDAEMLSFADHPEFRIF